MVSALVLVLNGVPNDAHSNGPMLGNSGGHSSSGSIRSNPPHDPPHDVKATRPPLEHTTGSQNLSELEGSAVYGLAYSRPGSTGSSKEPHSQTARPQSMSSAEHAFPCSATEASTAKQAVENAISGNAAGGILPPQMLGLEDGITGPCASCLMGNIATPDKAIPTCAGIVRRAAALATPSCTAPKCLGKAKGGPLAPSC